MPRKRKQYIKIKIEPKFKRIRSIEKLKTKQNKKKKYQIQDQVKQRMR